MTEIITPIIIILPSRSKVAVRVGESGGKLAEVAVERWGEALKRDAKVFVKSFENGQRQSALSALALVACLPSHVRLITLE